MEICAFGNNGHYKYRAALWHAIEPRIVDDHGTNNNDYFISINLRKLNSSGKSKGHSLACYSTLDRRRFKTTSNYIYSRIYAYILRRSQSIHYSGLTKLEISLIDQLK